VIYDFSDGLERNLDYFASRALDLDAWRGQRLSRLHAANDAANACSVCRYDLHVVHPVERAQGCEGFGYFHWCLPRFLSDRLLRATILRFRPLKKALGAVKTRCNPRAFCGV
jgi:hypothetical protein